MSFYYEPKPEPVVGFGTARRCDFSDLACAQSNRKCAFKWMNSANRMLFELREQETKGDATCQPG
jgi:hypothetical protein